MKFNSLQSSFSAGELSRYLKGRTTIDEYFSGAEIMENFIPLRQGGAAFRAGTGMANTSSYNQKAAIIEFSPKDGESYLVHLFPNNGATQAFVQDASTGVIQPQLANSFLWNKGIDFSSSTRAYAGTDATDVTNKIDKLQHIQIGSTLIIVDGTGELAPILMVYFEGTFYFDSYIHPFFPTKLSSIVMPVKELVRVPYGDTNISTSVNLTPSATTGVGTSITILSKDSSAVALNYFTGDVVGMMIKITQGATTGVAVVTNKVSDSNVTCTVIVPFSATTASTNFELSEWYPENGYPRSIAYYEQRLLFGGNKKKPDTIWASATANIYLLMQRRLAQDASTDASGLNFFGTAKTTDPFSFIPAAREANDIQWMFASDTLLVGTSAQELSISGTDSAALSQTSIFIKSISSHGSSKVMPIKVGSSVLFVSFDGKRLLEIPKRLAEYTSATDLGSIAEGIIDKSLEFVASDTAKVQNKIKKMVWSDSEGVLWILCKNESNAATSLISVTIDKTTKTIAWARQPIAKNPEITSICSGKDKLEGNTSKLFLYGKVSGASKYFLTSMYRRNVYDKMRLHASFLSKTPATVYVDYAFPYEKGTHYTTEDHIYIEPTYHKPFLTVDTVFSVLGADINGENITYIGDYTPEDDGLGWKLTVPTILQYDLLIVGVKYSGKIRTMPLEAGAQFGVAQGSLRRVHEMSVFVDRSLNGTYKSTASEDTFDIRDSNYTGEPETLYTGEVRLSANNSPYDSQLEFQQNDPYPLTILWLLIKGYTYDA